MIFGVILCASLAGEKACYLTQDQAHCERLMAQIYEDTAIVVQCIRSTIPTGSIRPEARP